MWVLKINVEYATLELRFDDIAEAADLVRSIAEHTNMELTYSIARISEVENESV